MFAVTDSVNGHSVFTANKHILMDYKTASLSIEFTCLNSVYKHIKYSSVHYDRKHVFVADGLPETTTLSLLHTFFRP